MEHNKGIYLAALDVRAADTVAQRALIDSARTGDHPVHVDIMPPEVRVQRGRRRAKRIQSAVDRVQRPLDLVVRRGEKRTLESPGIDVDEGHGSIAAPVDVGAPIEAVTDPRRRAPKRCSRCRVAGHIARVCPTKPNALDL